VRRFPPIPADEIARGGDAVEVTSEPDRVTADECDALSGAALWGLVDWRAEREAHPCGMAVDSDAAIADHDDMGKIATVIVVVATCACVPTGAQAPIPSAHGGERTEVSGWPDVSCFDRRGVAICAQTVAWCEAARRPGDGVCVNLRQDGMPESIDLAADVRVIDSGPGPRAKKRAPRNEDAAADERPTLADRGRYCTVISLRAELYFICDPTLDGCEEGARRARVAGARADIGLVNDCYDAGDEPPTKTIDGRALPEPTSAEIEADGLERSPIGDADYEPGKGCRRGCACGHSCIDCSKRCNVGRPPPTRSPGAITCRTGCRCGNACISCSKRCRK
jgi:hypothetical protein